MADYLRNWHLQLSSSNNTLRRITIQSLYWYGQLVWTPALGGLFVSVCVSIRGHDPTTTNDSARPRTTINDRARPRTNAYMLRFCSAHDEWFIMKLLQVCHVLPTMCKLQSGNYPCLPRSTVRTSLSNSPSIPVLCL